MLKPETLFWRKDVFFKDTQVSLRWIRDSSA